MGKNMPYMVLDITKKPGDPNAVKTGDMLVAENAKLREALELARLYISLGPEAESRAHVKDGQVEMLHAADVIDKVSAALSAPPRKSSPPAAGKRAKGKPNGQ